ncbi:hypothetical protein Glove_319g195 [Diversispora epigaea]|uniref:Uncharacterized protein n=1 Tax=Diversispora epigaea TaxID=1348612 RepID=A0A397HPN4_9GLOM|nr:hypothetical protein Glove_319g195 [Diversispora epigaea]
MFYISPVLSSYIQGANFDKYNYNRGRLYENGTAICFRCMKLMYVNVNLGPDVDPFDLMKDHYDYECSRPQSIYGYLRSRTEFGCARVIQKLWRNFRKREPSDAQLAWNSLLNDNTLDDKKFLGLTQCKVKNSQTSEMYLIPNRLQIPPLTETKLFQRSSVVRFPPPAKAPNWACNEQEDVVYDTKFVQTEEEDEPSFVSISSLKISAEQ